MKKIIHEEKLICDVCKKEVDNLNVHYVIGRHFIPTDYQGLVNFVCYKDFKVEMCKNCEKKYEEITRKQFAQVYDCNYDPNVYVEKSNKDEEECDEKKR